MSRRKKIRLGLMILLLLALACAGCAAPAPEPEPDNSQPEQPELPQLTLGNFYLAIAGGSGAEDDGYLAAAGFLGYALPEQFARTAEEYGYAHLSRTPEWADGGGNQAWIIIPKYTDSQITVTALADITAADGHEYTAGGEIATAGEALIVFINPQERAADIRITISAGDTETAFSPRLSPEEAAILPPELRDISQYQPPDANADPLLGRWLWEQDGVKQYLEISAGSAETGSEGAYWMVSETLYPGADPGLGGPFGGMLTVEGERAAYHLSISEGELHSELKLALDGDSLTFTWVGGDRCFGLQNIGDSLTFSRGPALTT